MTAMTMEGHLCPDVTIDVCPDCQGFWFDQFESLKLAPGSTLKLMKYIGEHSTAAKPVLSDRMACPRCRAKLLLTHDMQRSTRFCYWRCPNEEGRFTGFFEFLKEKNFIHPLSPKEIKQVRLKVQVVNCSSCGAPIDLDKETVCSHCHSPICVLDMNQQQALLDQLKQAAVPKAVDPQLPAKLIMAKLEGETSLGAIDRHPQGWSNAATSGLVEAGLLAVGYLIRDLILDA